MLIIEVACGLSAVAESALALALWLASRALARDRTSRS
jgi:hypothetical protein